ncbi:TPA: DUF2264 domain-containing protein [Pseudomonas putida]|nr:MULTISPECIES: DUF2264 domain-containing protein [Pseudomonas]MCE1003570.1 DUF2264 domain-containing protein [Pseudomonas sp. NMI1173_11]
MPAFFALAEVAALEGFGRVMAGLHGGADETPGASAGLAMPRR